MAINYLDGTIDSIKQPLIHEALRIRDMEELSEGYCSSEAVWFDISTVVKLDLAEICYIEGRISPEADPELWYRIIKLPDDLGYIVDGSHLEEVQDDEGRFLSPLPVSNGLRYDGADPVDVNDYLRNTMQLEGASNILRDMFGYRLAKSALHYIVENTSSDSPDHSD